MQTEFVGHDKGDAWRRLLSERLGEGPELDDLMPRVVEGRASDDALTLVLASPRGPLYLHLGQGWWTLAEDELADRIATRARVSFLGEDATSDLFLDAIADAGGSAEGWVVPYELDVGWFARSPEGSWCLVKHNALGETEDVDDVQAHARRRVVDAVRN